MTTLENPEQEKDDGTALATGESAPTVAVNRRLFEQVLHAHQHLQGKTDLAGVINYLLLELPQSLELPAAELRLLDPDGDFARLLPQSLISDRAVQLSNDSFAMQDLYLAAPQVEVLDQFDERMFNILKWDDKTESAVMMPLFASGKLLGSYHWGVHDASPASLRGDMELLRSLTLSISAAFERTRRHQEQAEFALLDPASGIGNVRAYRRYMQREVSRATRFGQPLSLVYITIDNLSELSDSYGDSACMFLIKRVAQRLQSGLRETDSMARLSENRFAMFLPDCNEPNGHDIAGRLCRDIEEFAIDDSRGGILYTTISCGVVTWNPATLPADNPERIVLLMEAEAESAMSQSVVAGGNRVSIARLGVLMV